MTEETKEVNTEAATEEKKVKKKKKIVITTNEVLTPFSLIMQLRKDLKEQVKNLTSTEARFLVDTYYTIQDYRIQLGSQLRAAEQKVDENPSGVLAWIEENMTTMESTIRLALKHYVDGHKMGPWLTAQLGIGPVLSAGLLAYIDIKKAPTVGHIWSYAGLDPTMKWHGAVQAAKWVKGMTEVTEKTYIDMAKLSGFKVDAIKRFAKEYADIGKSKKIRVEDLKNALARRPWNAKLKVLCWKVGQSFVKLRNVENSYYGGVYRERDELEFNKSAAGDYRDQALARSKTVDKTTKGYPTYCKGELPESHIHTRAARYATKLFLAHMHEVWYKLEFKKDPPMPYAIAHGGHAHKIDPPTAG